MQIAERSAGNVTVLDLSGQITLSQGDQQFKDKINSLVHEGRHNILVNLASVTHVDSAGLGELVSGLYDGHESRRQHEAPEPHQAPARSAGHHEAVDVFDTFESEQDALKQFT